jgi:hypothetical protein
MSPTSKFFTTPDLTVHADDKGTPLVIYISEDPDLLPIENVGLLYLNTSSADYSLATTNGNEIQVLNMDNTVSTVFEAGFNTSSGTISITFNNATNAPASVANMRSHTWAGMGTSQAGRFPFQIALVNASSGALISGFTQSAIVSIVATKSPTFANATTSVTIENTSLGALSNWNTSGILDMTNNEKVSYAISGTDSSDFVLTSDGKLSIKNYAGFNGQPTYTFTLTATSLYSSTSGLGASAMPAVKNGPSLNDWWENSNSVAKTTVTINVDSSKPVKFLNSDKGALSSAPSATVITAYTCYVADGSTNIVTVSGGSTSAKVYTTDNNKVTYSITGTDAKYITIDNTTGVISLKSNADANKPSGNYDFNVVASTMSNNVAVQTATLPIIANITGGHPAELVATVLTSSSTPTGIAQPNGAKGSSDATGNIVIWNYTGFSGSPLKFIQLYAPEAGTFTATDVNNTNTSLITLTQSFSITVSQTSSTLGGDVNKPTTTGVFSFSNSIAQFYNGIVSFNVRFTPTNTNSAATVFPVTVNVLDKQIPVFTDVSSPSLLSGSATASLSFLINFKLNKPIIPLDEKAFSLTGGSNNGTTFSVVNTTTTLLTVLVNLDTKDAQKNVALTLSNLATSAKDAFDNNSNNSISFRFSYSPTSGLNPKFLGTCAIGNNNVYYVPLGQLFVDPGAKCYDDALLDTNLGLATSGSTDTTTASTKISGSIDTTSEIASWFVTYIFTKGPQTISISQQFKVTKNKTNYISQNPPEIRPPRGKPTFNTPVNSEIYQNSHKNTSPVNYSLDINGTPTWSWSDDFTPLVSYFDYSSGLAGVSTPEGNYLMGNIVSNILDSNNNPSSVIIHDANNLLGTGINPHTRVYTINYSATDSVYGIITPISRTVTITSADSTVTGGITAKLVSMNLIENTSEIVIGASTSYSVPTELDGLPAISIDVLAATFSNLFCIKPEHPEEFLEILTEFTNKGTKAAFVEFASELLLGKHQFDYSADQTVINNIVIPTLFNKTITNAQTGVNGATLNGNTNLSSIGFNTYALQNIVNYCETYWIAQMIGLVNSNGEPIMLSTLNYPEAAMTYNSKSLVDASISNVTGSTKITADFISQLQTFLSSGSNGIWYDSNSSHQIKGNLSREIFYQIVKSAVTANTDQLLNRVHQGGLFNKANLDSSNVTGFYPIKLYPGDGYWFKLTMNPNNNSTPLPIVGITPTPISFAVKINFI